MRTIYLVHVTGDETHFLALYKYAQEYGYTASHQIILKKMAICRRLAINIKRGDCFKGISTFLKDVFMHFRLYILKDKDLIVGIAPYDRVMNKYKWIFMRNRCFYFTSDHHWCSPYPSVGDIKNRERYEAILKQCFRGIFCVSKETESQVKKFGLPTSVVNHAVDHDMYKKRIKRGNGEKKSYVFVGSYNERKNVRLILSWLEANPEETKTGKGRRTITLPPSTAQLLRERQKRSCSQWIFPNPLRPEDPVNPGRAYSRLKTLLKSAGLPGIRFHDLRHTFATHALTSGVDAKTLSGILGHTKASFTLDTYTHVTGDMHRRAAEIVGGFLDDIMVRG